MNRDGGRLYFGWPWDPGIAHPGWRAWTLGQSRSGEPDARHVTLMSGALGFEFVTPPDPTLTVANFDFERDPLRMQSFHRVYGTADDVLLRPFQQRGGKLMLVHGMADPIFSALETVDYQQRVNAAHGQAASRFVRTFLVPGMNHCAGGPATDAFDGLSAIVDWVETRPRPRAAGGTRHHGGARASHAPCAPTRVSPATRAVTRPAPTASSAADPLPSGGRVATAGARTQQRETGGNAFLRQALAVTERLQRAVGCSRLERPLR